MILHLHFDPLENHKRNLHPDKALGGRKVVVVTTKLKRVIGGEKSLLAQLVTLMAVSERQLFNMENIRAK